MLKTLVFLALSILTVLSLSLNASQTVTGRFQPLQPEDMSYYQNFHWSKPVPRKELYQSRLNGYEHMYEKMMTCLSMTIYDLPEQIGLFKDGGHEPDEHMKEGSPIDSVVVSDWLVYNFAEKIYQTYNGSLDPENDNDPALRHVRNEFWSHCLISLDVWLFTQAAQRRADGDANWREFLREGEPLNKK
ncbi:hypothetical protein Q3O59_10215 [Alkalimonas delamerensis]|uniref:Uncharacterized protein n=1 Tax=Alkalimonas delamerensis TaxID=265981 RepID=A0ABT9GR03_9GAMM|nr:hypothetical protein [Alkalimonas delamerensis]MDP4529397.1 hypothetical protein [Alkalimonas delamerensis]